MGVLASARDKLGDLWARLKGWAHSVPPDVWIGLAIAAATLIVVYLAYKKAGSSSNDGLSTSNPIIGQSNTPGTTPLTSQDVTGSNSGLFDISKLWTDPKQGSPGKPGHDKPGYTYVPSTLAQIIKSATTRDESVTARMSSNTNSAYASMVAISPYVQSIASNVPDESRIARSIQMPAAPSPIITSATTRDESVVAKIVQAVKPQPKPATAPIRPSPFAITSTPTQRGVNISY